MTKFNYKRMTVPQTHREVNRHLHKKRARRTPIPLGLIDTIIRKQQLLRTFDKKRGEEAIRNAETGVELGVAIRKVLTSIKEWNALQSITDKLVYTPTRKHRTPRTHHIPSKVRYFRYAWMDDEKTVRAVSGPLASVPKCLNKPWKQDIVCYWHFDKDGKHIRTVYNRHED